MRPADTELCSPELRAGMHVFWRFKGEKEWKRGYVRLASGRMVEFATPLRDTLARVDEIEWEPNDE